MSQFYKLHRRTRRRHGAPPQPFRFFDNIYRHLIEVGSGFITLASRDGKAVAGAVYLTHGKNAVYKFGASDERYNQYRANNLVMWEAIKYLCEDRCEKPAFRQDFTGQRRFEAVQAGMGRAGRGDPILEIHSQDRQLDKCCTRFQFACTTRLSPTAPCS